MITIKHSNFKSNIALANILAVKTKADMLKICKTLDLYVSPNLKKDETARRVAAELLHNPEAILYSLCKAELQLLDEFVRSGEDAYVTRKARKTEYKLQKFGLVLTYIDETKGEWKMLMPDSVRNSLSVDYKYYLQLAEGGKKGPSPKELRMMSFMKHLMD
ncbi:MAG: hypothetical protein IJZ38_02595 [Bacteroides sp.]|nr:hypothetical protein [Bacteroides sp.]